MAPWGRESSLLFATLLEMQNHPTKMSFWDYSVIVLFCPQTCLETFS